MEFARLAAGHAHGSNSGQPGKLWTNGVVGDVSQAGQIARIRGKTVAGHGKHGEGKPLNVLNFRRWRQRRGHLRKARLHKLERLNNIDIPVEEQTYLRRSPRSLRLNALDPRNTVHRFFDWTSDGDQSL